MKLHIEKGLNLGTPAHKVLSAKQFLAQNQVLEWNTHSIPLISL
jgi:hypothetical protein